MYRLDEGALLDDCFHFLEAIDVMALREQVHGTAIPREMIPFVQYLLRYGLKTLCGIERLHALPHLLCSDEALMQLVGFKAHQVRQGVCHRGDRAPGGAASRFDVPDILANNMVQCHVRDLDAMFNGGIRALAKAGGFGKRVPGMADGPDLETTARDQGCDQATRQRRIEEKWGRVQDIDGTVYGWKLIVLIDARTKLPLAATVVPIQAHETLSLRALVTQARINLAGDARLHTVGLDQGCVDGTDLGWLDQQGLRCVVPAKAKMAVVADARAQAAAGEEITVGRRAHTVRHGQGKAAWRARLETAVVGLTGLTP